MAPTRIPWASFERPRPDRRAFRQLGAEGPYRVTPNLMVVVPTANDVRLHYGRTSIEWLGLLLTLLGRATA